MMACPLCASNNVVKMFVKGDIPYWNCRECRFRFSTPKENANLTNRIEDFESCYIQYLEAGPTDRRNFADVLRWMSRIQPVDGRAVLDVGCGSGKFVRYLRDRGIDACGLEPCTALYEKFLSSEPHFLHGDLCQLAAQTSQRFDTITAFDVLEHVEHPVAFLDNISRLLTPDGILWLSLPDVGSLSARLFGRYWHFYNRYHLSYFSRHSIVRATSPFGLKTVAFSRRGRCRSLGYIARYAFDFVLGNRPPGGLNWLDSVILPVNLFDTMYVGLRKAAI